MSNNSLGSGGEDEGGGGSCPGTPELRRRQEDAVRRLAAQVRPTPVGVLDFIHNKHIHWDLFCINLFYLLILFYSYSFAQVTFSLLHLCFLHFKKKKSNIYKNCSNERLGKMLTHFTFFTVTE